MRREEKRRKRRGRGILEEEKNGKGIEGRV